MVADYFLTLAAIYAAMLILYFGFGLMAEAYAARFPDRKDVSVVIVELRMMQIVERRTNERPWAAGCGRGEKLKPRMADHAADLVEQAQGKDRQRRHWQDEPDDEVKAVFDQRIDHA